MGMENKKREINGDLCHDILIQKIKPKLSFDEKKDYKTWKESVKEKLYELLGIDLVKANACAPNMEIEEDVLMDGYRRIRFTFESEVGAIVPCYLLIPDTNKKKYPVGIVLQGHTSGFHISLGIPKSEKDEETIKSRDFAIQAVKEGYAALCIEQRCMGERVTSRHTFSSNMCTYPALAALMLGRTTLGERVWDVQRAIDQLSHFEMLDLDKIFITGNSGGGTMSFYASCFDDRIKICAPSSAFCSFEKSLFWTRHCPCNHIPGVYLWLEMQDMACLVANKEFISINGQVDMIFSIEGAKDAFKTVEKIFEKEGKKDSCELVITPEGHAWCKDLVWPAIRRHAEKLGWFND